MPSSRTRKVRHGRPWPSLVILLSTLVIGIGFVWLVAGMGNRIEHERTLALARTVAAGVNSAWVAELRGDADDAGKPGFEALHHGLKQVRAANPDFRFVYLMRPSPRNPGQLLFLVDAEDPESEDYSAPGDVYDGPSEDLWTAWNRGEALVQLAHRDAWGQWVTAIAPVHAGDGSLVAVLGMDLRADAWQATLARYRNFAVAIVALILLLEASFLIGLRKQRATALRVRALNARLAGQVDELRAAEASLRMADVVVRHTGEAIVLLDAGLRVLRVNTAFTRITGFEGERILGRYLPLFEPDDDDLLRRIRADLKQQPHWAGTLWARRASGERFPMEGSVDLVRDANGEILQYVVVFRDVTEQKRLEDRLRELSVTDALTGLPNRRHFDDALDHQWQQCMRRRQPISLIMIDIDHFKAYNDHYGHPAGDHVLRQVADTLCEVGKREAALVTRYGGEEFAVILPDCDDLRVAAIAEDLRSAITNLAIPHQGNPKAPMLTISLGTSTRQPPEGSSVDALLLSADRALYSAKGGGRNTVVVSVSS